MVTRRGTDRPPIMVLMANLDDKGRPHLTERALAEKRARERRQAEALRANLRRRKEQEPARDEAPDEPKHG